MQESFIFYDSFREVGKDMEEKSRLAFYETIIDYALTGELDDSNLSKEIKRLFTLAKPQIDANVKKKKDGKKGGRPVKTINSEEKNNEETIIDEEENYEETTGFENKNHGFQNKKPNVNVNDNVNVNVNVYEYTQKQFGRTLAPAELELIKSWNYSEEIIKLAVDETVLNQVNNIKYTDKILYEWEKQGLKTVNDIEDKLKQRKEKEIADNVSDVSYYRSLE